MEAVAMDRKKYIPGATRQRGDGPNCKTCCGPMVCRKTLSTEPGTKIRFYYCRNADCPDPEMCKGVVHVLFRADTPPSNPPDASKHGI